MAVRDKHDAQVVVIGGGLAGCEAAWQLAERGLRVRLVEGKPTGLSPAHQTPLLAEIVCSNSLRSDSPTAPAGLLKHELRGAGSLVIACADETRVPAGEALAVDRFAFSRVITSRVARHPKITIWRQAIADLPTDPSVPVVVATGPLTGGGLARTLGHLCGKPLYFYDAIAPIIDAESVDPNVVFRASRYDRGVNDEQPDGDYLNCPMNEEEYYTFIHEVLNGRKVTPHAFEQPKYFEGCLPIEVMAERGAQVLAHGPMKPVGLIDPRSGRQPYAVVQLRAENSHGTAYNLVGFQTRLAYPEQNRIFRLIPGLADVEFIRFGSIHRNSYVDSPRLLGPHLEIKGRPYVHLAGQISGVEGYIESTAMGLLVGRFVAAKVLGQDISLPPPDTAIGALYHHLTRARAKGEPFVPMNINFGLMPPLPGRVHKKERREAFSTRAQNSFAAWV